MHSPFVAKNKGSVYRQNTHQRSFTSGCLAGKAGQLSAVCAILSQRAGGGPEADGALTLAAALPQLSGLLQVCVRTGTETQAKLASVELFREYISVSMECAHVPWQSSREGGICSRSKGIFFKTELRPHLSSQNPYLQLSLKSLMLRARFSFQNSPQAVSLHRKENLKAYLSF